MGKPDCAVAVVGAGPVGLAGALGLAQNDWSVLVLEKNEGLSEHSRAPLIWPRTQEILSELGVVSRFEEDGIVRSRIRLFNADQERVLLRYPIEELRGETPFPQVILCPQSQTERILYEALQEEPSAEVHFSTEVTGLRQSRGSVEVRFEQDGQAGSITAAYAAGCDGAHSRVRDAIGSSFGGRTYRAQAALADLTFDQEQNVRFPRMTRRRGVATAIRIDDDLWRLIMPRASEGSAPLGRRIERAVADLFPASSFETVWKSEFNLHRRVSSSFVNQRVVLAGDAAHLTSPVGGQGMNLGLQDASALVSALDGALERNTLTPLSRYTFERQEAIETGAVWATDRLTQLLLARRGTFLVPFLRLFGFALRIRPLRQMVMRRMAMLDEPSRDQFSPSFPIS
jgi:2-polyprenyl-6-methoxyphenol hydroxylase-like FAD-dependent oxidoreductase